MQPQTAFNFTGYRPEFVQWMNENPTIWERFQREANRIWNRGRRHYSARTIVEYIRHETSLYEQGGDFKINNNMTPDLARFYLELHPERAELFELRRLRKVAEAA